MGPKPADYIRSFQPARDAVSFSGLGHRWTRSADLVALLWILKQMLDRHGTIEEFFLEGYDRAAPDVDPPTDGRAKARPRSRCFSCGRVGR